MLAPFPSMEFESEIPPIGNPDSGKKQQALGQREAARTGNAINSKRGYWVVRFRMQLRMI